MTMRDAGLPIHVAALTWRRIFSATAPMRLRECRHRHDKQADSKNDLPHRPLLQCLKYAIAREITRQRSFRNRKQEKRGSGLHSNYWTRESWAVGLADGVGFEPTVGVNPRRFSRPVP